MRTGTQIKKRRDQRSREKATQLRQQSLQQVCTPTSHISQEGFQQLKDEWDSILKSYSMRKRTANSTGTQSTNVHNAVFADPHLTPAEKVTYFGLKTFAYLQNIFPSLTEICQRTALSRMTVQRSLRNLEAFGYIQVKKRGGKNKNGGVTDLYFLLYMPNGCAKCTTEKYSTGSV